MTYEHEPASDQPPGQREYRPEGYDIGVVFKSPFRDDQWIKKVVVMGLIGLIPIVGWLNLLGWLKANYEARKRDALDLPDAGFDYIAAGFRVFLAFLPAGLALVIAQVFLGVLGGDGGLIGGLFGLVATLLGLAFAFVTPAILYLAVRDDDLGASLRFDELKRIVADGATSTYLLLVVTMVLLSVFANLGSALVCVGALFTTPLAAAMAGAALAEFDAERS